MGKEEEVVEVEMEEEVEEVEEEVVKEEVEMNRRWRRRSLRMV